MKKRIITALICAAVISTTIAGCGPGNDSGEASVTVSPADLHSEEDSIPGFTLVKVSDEIKNSHITDMFVQVGNVIIPTDGSITLGEVVEKLTADAGEITITNSKGDKTITSESLMSESESYKLKNAAGNGICNIWCGMDKEGVISAYDSIVLSVNHYDYSIEDLNFFYPGNICAGTYLTKKDYFDSWEYKERLEEYPPFTYTEAQVWVEEQLEAGGIEIYQEDDFKLKVYNYDKPMYTFEDGEDVYVQKTYNLNVDLTDNRATSFGAMSSIGSVYSWFMDYPVYDLDELSAEEKADAEAVVIEKAKEGWWPKAKDVVEIVGTYITYTDYSGKKLCVVFKSDIDGRYYDVVLPIRRLVDGSLSFDSQSFGVDNGADTAEGLVETYISWGRTVYDIKLNE